MDTSALVAAISHGIGGATYAAFALLLALGRREQGPQYMLVAACVLSALWSGSIALQGWSIAGIDMAQMPPLLETVRTAAWMAFLLQLLLRAGVPVLQMGGAVVILAIVQIAAGEVIPAAALAPADPSGPYTHPAAMLAIGSRLLLAVLGIFLVEHLFRSTPAHERWGIKFACLGLGTVFVYDFYLYSDALLFRRVQADIWAARGLVNALCVPLLAVAAARNPAWKLALVLSRKMLLRSAALIGCAAYLLAMAAGGWYLRSVGGAWGPVMQLACLFGAGLLLIGVLFSGTARARVRIFVSKHFYQAHFDYRDEWRRFTQALSAGGPAPGQRAIQAIAALVESPAGALWVCRDGVYQPAASWNVPPQQATEPADSPLCHVLEQRHWIIEVPRHANDGTLPSWLYGVPGLWLVVPLVLHGHLFGFVALTAPRTPVAPNWEVFDLLRLAGSQAASCLAHGELADRIAVARQFDSFNRMSTFVVHDLKNLLSQHSLLLANAERHKANPAFQEDMLATLAHSVTKMTALLQRLSRGEHCERSLPLALRDIVRGAAAAYETGQPPLEVRIADESLFALADGQRLERTIAHLLQNAIDATPLTGHVRLTLRREGDVAVIEVSDTGSGMSDEFIRDRLFRPFETTKAGGMGIGVYESREYIRELGGNLLVSSRVGSGSTFSIVLPVHCALPEFGNATNRMEADNAEA